MEVGDVFHLEIGQNNNYSIVKTFVSGVDFNSNMPETASVVMNMNSFNDGLNSIRIRSASSEDDFIILDDIVISGCNYDENTCLEGAACNDNDICTVGETYDSDCNCTGGVYIDNDADGFCIGEDPDDNNSCVPDIYNSACDEVILECEEISRVDFENDYFGIWNDGGFYARLLTNVEFANSGTHLFYIHDNQGVESSLYSDDLDLSEYYSLNLSFSYYPFSMESGDKFYLEIATDNDYETYITYTGGQDFFNEQRVNTELLIQGITFSDETSLRFRVEGDENEDFIMLDDIVLEGCTEAGFQEINISSRSSNQRQIESESLDPQIYPNPASDVVTVECPNYDDEKTVLVSVYNLQGQELKSIKLSQNIQNIDISDLPSQQVYLFRVSENGAMGNSFKILKY